LGKQQIYAKKRERTKSSWELERGDCSKFMGGKQRDKPILHEHFIKYSVTVNKSRSKLNSVTVINLDAVGKTVRMPHQSPTVI
jgi:hypothetical protein